MHAKPMIKYIWLNLLDLFLSLLTRRSVKVLASMLVRLITFLDLVMTAQAVIIIQSPS